MAQSSGPIAQGTTSERQFTDVMWRDRFGDESGVLGDLDGTAYALALSAGSDIASVGSSSQASLATVAGFVHRIPMGSPEPITIPAASGATRTDIIGLRYDPSYTGLPGPVRLYRTVGTSAAIPTYDSSPPGVEDLPLWSITRQVGQGLNQATVQRMFPRLAPSLDLPVGAELPTSSPLATTVQRGPSSYRRDLVGGTAQWTQLAGPIENVPTMASRPTTNRAIGMRISPLDRPSLVYVWDGTYWRHEGLVPVHPTGNAPAGAYFTRLEGSEVTNIGNSAGGFNIAMNHSFAAPPLQATLSPGDSTEGLAYVIPLPGNWTANSLHGSARRTDGSGAGNVGGVIRINFSAIGYNV